MKKREFSTQLLWCFPIIFLLMVTGCGKSNDTSYAAAPTESVSRAALSVLDPSAYTQDDLTGTWHVNMLNKGSSNGWMRAIVTVDSTGALTFSSCLDSNDNTKCPAGPIQWTIDANGVISETDNDTATDFHYTMTLGKNFIAGTGTSSSGTSRLTILQKEEAGHIYNTSDMADSNFVYHSLVVGENDNIWFHGNGVIGAEGSVFIASETSPYGTNPLEVSGTMTLESNGIASLSGVGIDNFRGFVSADNKTLVGTATCGEGVYSIWIAQLNTREFDTPNLEGRNFNHMLTARDATGFWAHQTIDIDSNGAMSFSDWVSSDASVTGPADNPSISISLTGTATITGTDFHGQLSDDNMFMVGTQTFDNGSYSLMVITRPTPLAAIHF